MSLIALGYIGLGVCLVLIFLGMPIVIAFAIPGILGLLYIIGIGPTLSALGTIPYAAMNNYTFSCIPLFIFMGFLALHSGLAEDFFDGIRNWIGRTRGGLAISVIAGNTAFGACCGDTISAAATFSVISLPALRKYNYADSLTMGSVGAGSVLSQLIPPSLGFIVYGLITMTSVSQLFVAGILPGLLLGGIYAATIYVLCLLNPKLGPPSDRTTFGEKIRGTYKLLPLVVVFGIIIGGLYVGLFSPTEAGAGGAFVVLVLSLARRRLSWQKLKQVLLETGLITTMVAVLIIAFMVFNAFLVLTGAGVAIAEYVCGVTESSTGTLLIITVLFLVLGMFMDALAMILLIVPVLLPTLLNMGVDPIQFGVIAVMTMGIGTISPPVGIALYAMHQVVKDVSITTISKGILPFIAAALVCGVILVYVPQISLLLPSMMLR